MRILLSILLLFATCLNAQITTINGSGGRTATINAAGKTSSVSINKITPSALAVSKQQINLRWGAISGAEIYIVERATDAGFTDVQPVYAGTDLRFINTGLSQNTNYWYRISWSDDATTQTMFAILSATTFNAGVLYDIDAEAIIAAIQSTVTLNTTTKEAIDDYVTTLKADGLWTKVKTIHLGHFADWFANSLNWKNPDFEIEGFPEIYSGDVNHVNGKIAFEGVGNANESLATIAFSTNWLVPLNYLGQDDKAYTFNITDAPNNVSGSDQMRFGSTESASGDAFTIIGLPNGITANESSRIGGANDGTIDWMDENLPGFYVLQRSGAASGDVLFRKDGVSLLTSLNASTGNVDLPIATAGQYSNAPNTNSLSFKTFGRNFFAITESFDVTEMADWEAANATLLAVLDAQTFTATTPPSTDCRYLRFFGDSFTRWPSSGASSGEKGWWVRLGQRFNILPTTHAIGSVGYFSQVNACYTNLTTPSIDRMVILNGYNDVKVFGTNTEGIEHGKSATRAMIINQFLASAVPASDASVTKTGTWSANSISTSKGNHLGGTPMQSSTAGDKISYSFTGTNISVGVRHSDGTAAVYGSVQVTIDGSPASITGNMASEADDEYSMNNKAYNVTSSGGFIFGAFQVKGLANTSHTIEIELLESQTTIIDYFGQLQSPSLCLPILIGDIQHDNTGTANRNDNADNLSDIIWAMVEAEFTEHLGKIGRAATNAHYNGATQVDPDNVHRNDTGYKQIYREFERVWIY